MPRRKTTTSVEVVVELPPPVSARTVTENDDETFPSVLPVPTRMETFMNSIWAVRLPIIGTALLVLTALIGLAI